MNLFLGYLLLGAFIWRITPLSMNHPNWVSVVLSLLLVYYWIAVLFTGAYFLGKGIEGLVS